MSDTESTLPEAGRIAVDGGLVLSCDEREKVELANPALLALPRGRLIAALDQLGPGVKKLPGAKGRVLGSHHWAQGQILVSNDGGANWTARQTFPFANPCLFADGQALYLIGHRGNVQIMRSSDGGESWSRPAELTATDARGGSYVSTPGAVVRAGGRLCCVMMRRRPDAGRSHAPPLVPVCFLASPGADLTNRKSWTVADTGAVLTDLAPPDQLDFFGLPFFDVPEAKRGVSVAPGRWASQPRWVRAHPAIIADPSHYWYGGQDALCHVVFETEAHNANLAALARLARDRAGTARLYPERVPSGRKAVFQRVPGGNLPFALCYDEQSGLFWLAGNRVTDSMTRAEKLPRGRMGLPGEERHRLQLCYSRNLVDWCTVGLVDAGASPDDTRHTPALAVRGNDLCVLCCRGPAHHRPPYGTQQIQARVVPAFRDLAR